MIFILYRTLSNLSVSLRPASPYLSYFLVVFSRLEFEVPQRFSTQQIIFQTRRSLLFFIFPATSSYFSRNSHVTSHASFPYCFTGCISVVLSDEVSLWTSMIMQAIIESKVRDVQSAYYCYLRFTRFTPTDDICHYGLNKEKWGKDGWPLKTTTVLKKYRITQLYHQNRKHNIL